MRWLVSSLAMICLASGVVRARAEDRELPATAPGPVAVRSVYDLTRCLALAQQNYPKIQEAKARLGYKRGQLWQARTQPFSEFTVTGGVGPAPTVRGTNIYSPNTDVSLSSDMGLG